MSRKCSNAQSLEVAENFCYFGYKTGVRGLVVYNILARVMNEWRTFMNLLPFLTSKGLPLVSKGRL